ncbi:MAG: hypothetical protein JST23_10245 [Bacteroidetes bacterium]|nr:hypothetical protein [Bacteroidota bacterium]
MEQTVKQIGYPRWDKMLASKKKDNTKAGRNSSDDSTYIYNIPFVRENENYVNASLNIKITGADTTFGYSCDWQYQNKTHGSPNVDTTAEYHALFFMILDNMVLGHSRFKINDTILFDSISFNTGGIKEINLLKINSTIAGRSNNQNHNLCFDFYICNTPSYCGSHCDYLYCTTNQCYLLREICDGWWDDDGGSGGTGGGYEGEGSGAGGNGGGGNGGGTPPNCDPGTSYNKTTKYPPCEPGWEPEEEYSSGYPSAEPIDSLLKRYAQFVNRFRDSLSQLSEVEHVERFFCIVNNNNHLDTLNFKVGTNDNEIVPNFYVWGRRILLGDWHYHHKYADGTIGSWPSGEDVGCIYKMTKNYIRLVDTYNARYALVVEDVNKMQLFSHIAGNGPLKIMERYLDACTNDPRYYQVGNPFVTMTKDKLLEILGNSNNCGIGLYEASSANGTTFIKIN